MSLRIQTPDVAAALQRFFGIKGDIRPTLAQELIGVVLVGDIGQEGPPAPRRLATASENIAAAGVEIATWSLDMPAGTLAHITGFSCSGDSANVVHASFDSVAGATGAVAVEAFLDTRLLVGTGNTPFGQVVFGTQAAFIANRAWSQIMPLVTGLQVVNPGWIIFNPVGSGQQRSIIWQLENPNIDVDFAVEWAEYSLVGD